MHMHMHRHRHRHRDDGLRDTKAGTHIDLYAHIQAPTLSSPLILNCVGSGLYLPPPTPTSIKMFQTYRILGELPLVKKELVICRVKDRR